MSKFAFNSISEAFTMQSLNGQNHGLYVWSVLAIVFFTLLITFLGYFYVNAAKTFTEKWVGKQILF